MRVKSPLLRSNSVAVGSAGAGGTRWHHGDHRERFVDHGSCASTCGVPWEYDRKKWSLRVTDSRGQEGFNSLAENRARWHSFFLGLALGYSNWHPQNCRSDPPAERNSWRRLAGVQRRGNGIYRLDAFLAEDHWRRSWAGIADRHTCCDLGHLRDSARMGTAGSSPRPPDGLGSNIGRTAHQQPRLASFERT